MIPDELKTLAAMAALRGEEFTHWDGTTLKLGWQGRDQKMPPLGTLDILFKTSAVYIYGRHGQLCDSEDNDEVATSADYAEVISHVTLP